MIASVARYAPSIVAGSALAGFGLSFGRDAYKKAKKNWPLILILVSLFGVYLSGMWLFRNYRTLVETVFKKLGALILLIASCVGVYAGISFSALALLPIGIVGLETTNTSIDNIDIGQIDDYIFSFPLLWIFVAQVILFTIGSAMGIGHRKKRLLAWEAEEHNEYFLSEHGLELIDKDEKGNPRFRDHTHGVGYRMMDDLEVVGELEFMALGKRNKRGYIQYDDTGKFTHWSGLVDIR